MLKYDTPIQVSEAQYKILSTQFQGAIMHRKADDGTYWIKYMGFSKKLSKIIEDIISNERTK